MLRPGDQYDNTVGDYYDLHLKEIIKIIQTEFDGNREDKQFYRIQIPLEYSSLIYFQLTEISSTLNKDENARTFFLLYLYQYFSKSFEDFGGEITPYNFCHFVLRRFVDYSTFSKYKHSLFYSDIGTGKSVSIFNKNALFFLNLTLYEALEKKIPTCSNLIGYNGASSVELLSYEPFLLTIVDMNTNFKEWIWDNSSLVIRNFQKISKLDLSKVAKKSTQKKEFIGSPIFFLLIIALGVLFYLFVSFFSNGFGRQTVSPSSEYTYLESDSSERAHYSWEKIVCSLWNASSDDYDRVHIYNQDGDLASYLDSLNVNEKKDVRLPLGEYEVLYYTKSGERRTHSFSVTDYNDGLFVSLP